MIAIEKYFPTNPIDFMDFAKASAPPLRFKAPDLPYLCLPRQTVQKEWTDYNDHMNVAYYMYSFDQAIDHAFSYLGCGETYARKKNIGQFAVQSHIFYLAELRAGEEMDFTLQMLGFGPGKIHFFVAMHNGQSGKLSATLEQLALNVDLKLRKSAPYSEEIYARIDALYQTQRHLPTPPQAGAHIPAPEMARQDK